MKNTIQAIEFCFKLGESTLKYVCNELSENPYDQRVQKSRDESLAILEPLIMEAEFVHKDLRVANLGKSIYNRYASAPKFSINEPKRGVESGLVKTILVVDDQYGRADDPMIPERYGYMQGYKFLLEDAFDHKKRTCTAERVIERIEVERRNQVKIDGILLDYHFGYQKTDYGREILKLVKFCHPKLPVIMLSSANLSELTPLMGEGMANYVINKFPSNDVMKEVLDTYMVEDFRFGDTK